MARSEPEFLLDGLCFPEGPRYRDGRLFFADQHAHEVVAVEASGARETVAQVPQQPSGLGWMPDGTLLIVSMRDRKLLALGSDGGLHERADLSQIASGHCNDMIVDARGRAYVGNFGFDLDGGAAPAPTSMALVDEAGSVRAVADELLFPNGCAITEDGKTLIVAETFAARLTAFDIAEDGSLSSRRLWAQLPAPPDGICLDAEGCIWLANPIPPGGFLRVAEGGEVRERIDLDKHAGYACMLGGPERRTLFLLEALSSQPPDCTPGNGRIRTLEVEVPGAGWPEYRP